MEKYLYISLVLCLSVACTRTESTRYDRSALRVKTMVVAEQTECASSSRYVGTIEAAHAVPLSMQTSGRVQHIYVKNGVSVRKGQTMVVLDDSQAQNALRTADATLRHAQDGYDRTAKVYDKGVVSDQKMVEIESELAQAKAMYAAAKQRVSECTMIAPCDGIVSDLNLEIGQTVIPGVKICSVMDVSGFSVRFTVPETEVNGLGSTGVAECAAVDSTFPIIVVERNYIANALTHSYDIVAEIEGGADVLMAGMVAKVQITNPQSDITNLPSAIIIPASCVLLKPEGYTVWVKEGGVAVRRLITTDGYRANGICISSGLAVGDSLITDGYQKLYNGCKVIENQ